MVLELVPGTIETSNHIFKTGCMEQQGQATAVACDLQNEVESVFVELTLCKQNQSILTPTKLIKWQRCFMLPWMYILLIFDVKIWIKTATCLAFKGGKEYDSSCYRQRR
jgi:hypothetical protein